ncbi:MAG: DEAD/DEAH box helicase [Verrucomicrobia bacterium]|nr:DEAD/DEAH box helicase [Verrucomicrobiota bacterium]
MSLKKSAVGADAIEEEFIDKQMNSATKQGRIAVCLTKEHLYVANTGAPLSEEGLEALLHSHSSPKRGNQIGRFGIGFKSLLKLGGKVDIISHPLKISFHPERSRELIRKKLGLASGTQVAGLRMAWELSNEDLEDPFLESLSWATTVVRAEVSRETLLKHLEHEMREFRPEFVLFLPCDTHLEMEFPDGDRLKMLRESRRDEVNLHHGENITQWKIFEHKVEIKNQEALEDATGIHSRGQVPLIWALPIDKENIDIGQFWSFFPTESRSPLPGILNAPWKLDPGRSGLVKESAWNKCLMQEGAIYLAIDIASLKTPKDPAKPLDVFPLKLQEGFEFLFASTPVGQPLADFLWKELASVEILPNSLGVFHKASNLSRPPIDTYHLIKKWEALASEKLKGDLCGAPCFVGQRATALDRFSEHLDEDEDANAEKTSGKLKSLTLEEWIQRIADPDPIRSIKVLGFIHEYLLEKTRFFSKSFLTIPFLPTKDHQLCSPKDAVFEIEGHKIPGRKPLHPEFVADTTVRKILDEYFNLHPENPEIWTRALRDSLKEPEAFWKNAGLFPRDVVRKFIEENDSAIPFKRKDGKWRYIYGVLLPGKLVSEDDPENEGVLIDPVFFARYKEFIPEGLLKTSIPLWRRENQFFSFSDRCPGFLDEWFREGIQGFCTLPDLPSSPREANIRSENFDLPLWAPLYLELKGDSFGNATLDLICRVPYDKRLSRNASFVHTSKGYPTLPVKSPSIWLLASFGSLSIGGELLPLTALTDLRDEEFFEHVFEDNVHYSKVYNFLQDVSAPNSHQKNFRWPSLFTELLTEENLSAPWMDSLWNAAFRDNTLPDSLPILGTFKLRETVYISHNQEKVQRALQSGTPAVRIPQELLSFWTKHGSVLLEKNVSHAWEGSPTEGVAIEVVFPEFRHIILQEVMQNIPVYQVNMLAELYAENSLSVPWACCSNAIYVDEKSTASLNEISMRNRLLSAMDSEGWLSCNLSEALEKLDNEAVRSSRNRIASEAKLEVKIWMLAGEFKENLKQLKDLGKWKFIPDSTEGLDWARLALAVYGSGILVELSDTMRAEGFDPPEKWGTDQAHLFVEEIGFPAEFAQSRSSGRAKELWVDGPFPLPKLHEFQEDVIRDLRELWSANLGKKRAVLSLPTGSGKTFVTVVASIDHFLKGPAPRRVLWVAQTDELCEQAVQSFRQVWLNNGIEKTPLRIIRLWGGNSSPKYVPDPMEPTVVVSTIQTLNFKVESKELAWLRHMGLIVVDECHHAITKSYTGLLRGLNLEDYHDGMCSTPLLGLSATPFRSKGEGNESYRLAKRFDNRLFPKDQKNLHERMTSEGILAKVEGRHILSNAEVEPDLSNSFHQLWKENEDERDDFALGQVMEKINLSLAQNPDRSRLLVNNILSLQGKKILFFANSVEHAKEIAIRLELAGCSAAAISGDTSRSARRFFLSKFDRGDIQVLCNHSILTTGFDAPKTDVIFISRQVYSPVRYMQMVGRGLRGPKNRGTETCTVITVQDNLWRFDGKDPFDFVGQYFDRI